MWHRRARKTSTAIEKVVAEAHNPHIKNKVYWIVFPTYAEAKEAVWKDPNMLFRVVPEELVARKNEVELTLYLHSGSVIALKGADQPDRLRGAGPYGVIFDEFAEQKYEGWQIIEPVLRANGGWAWFIGTPRGKNHHYKHYLRGMEDNPQWKSWMLKASSSGIIPKDALKEALSTSANIEFYNQEYECAWLEGVGSVFKGVREIMHAQPKRPERGHIYVMGVDLAKVKDFTVITVYDRGTNAQVYQDRFKDLEWPFQKKKIQAVSEHYNNALVMLDATGIGDPITDDLLRAGVAVEPFKFTENSKKELVEKLSIWVQQRQMTMIDIQETQDEFDTFSYVLGPTGKVRYGAMEGSHDDIVMAHGLAIWSLVPLYAKKSVKKTTRIQREKLRRINRDEIQEDIEEAEWASLQ